MPNWEEDDDDSKRYCEYCGCYYDIDMVFGHVCQQMIDAQEKENEEYERRYKGNGKRAGRLIIDYECYDSESAFSTMMDTVSLFGGFEKEYTKVKTNF